MPITITKGSIDPNFLYKVEEVSGQPVRRCMQCGTCSGICPMDESTELTPRHLIHLAGLGLRDQVVTSNTSWMCASCHQCEVRCPRGLEVPKIIEAVRLVTLRENENYLEPIDVDKEQIKDMPQVAMVSSFRKHTA